MDGTQQLGSLMGCKGGHEDVKDDKGDERDVCLGMTETGVAHIWKSF